MAARDEIMTAKRLNILVLFIILMAGAVGCTGSLENNTPGVGTDSSLPVDTLFIVTHEAAGPSGKAWNTQKLRLGDPADSLIFEIGKPTRMGITTTQLTDYPLLVEGVQNAEADTSGLPEHYIILTPLRTDFRFDVYQDFRQRPVVRAFTWYDDDLEKVNTSYELLDDKHLIGKVKMSTR